MVDGNDAFTTTRRGALKTGALGLGGLTGAIALGGAETASAAALPSMDTVAALAGVPLGNFYLLLDGIPGDSVDDRHPKWVDVAEFSWKAANASTVTGSGWSASKPTISTLQLSASTGSHSAPLFLRTMNGRRLASAVLEVMTRGESPQTFIQVELKDVAVARYETSAAGGDDSPKDVIELAFAQIRYTIILPSSTGGPAGQTFTSTWNVRTGTGSSS